LDRKIAFNNHYYIPYRSFLVFGSLILRLYKNFNTDDLKEVIDFFLMYAILVGISEELCFRGMLYNKLLVLYNGKKNHFHNYL
jgi:membrane protease YdiL (CAAX protease family)